MYKNMVDLTGKVAVITGAAKNIGFASATALGEVGAHVVITDINPQLGQEATDNLTKKGISASFKSMDVSNSEEVSRVANEINQEFGRIDVLVANAGICFNTPGESIPDDEWQKVVDINLNGVYYCNRAFGNHMLNNPDGGRIVNIGSISGMIAPTPQPQAHYNATKAAVHMLTKSLAQEWAKRNVRVNAVAPTYVETDITGNILAEHQEWYDVWMGMTPMGRMGKPHEIASVVLFLASDLSSLMSGSVVVADAAYTCW
ncbi:oxidoreductase (plasmid) [Vibrio nigripulchritudo]|uniref:SDR family NAD(P)-dependent oxidoreductase n=1 Tax=Vibrio nigripulchritudo TaxID=28173 RepID=UPI00190A68E0|nr:SDR family oxidoreductase [Vibrio nigripulchritudo]BCL73657.1 oxidoreductase [Vibrio nigripulchritudo]BDU35026.1 oxidoreductase [Vibrio nigripulchritudo]